MERLIWIAVGGAAGTTARYLISSTITDRFDLSFPAGTFTVNLVGSFLLAALIVAALDSGWMSRTVFLAVGTGFMGAFTTYSTFSFETMELLETGQYRMAAIYVVATVGTCLVGSVGGAALSRWVS